jgi:RNA polymerase sigma-70 factor (ECF subfamily)
MTDHSTRDQRLVGLMQAAQAGDADSYVRLLHEITPLIRRIVRRRRRVPGTEDVEDLMQDVLLSVHAVRATYDPQGCACFIPRMRASWCWFGSLVPS